ncbi:MAG: molybdopterin-dependent oxidoreductase [Roseovarius sp.]
MYRVILTCLFTAVAALGPPFGPTGATAQENSIVSVIAEIDGLEVTQDFSLSDLSDLETAGFTTSTIWTDGEIAFEGVKVDTLLDHLNIDTGTLELVASNDYFVQIPVDQLRGTEGLLAYFMNGAPMNRRGKGPIWLVFPYDADVRYQSETYYSRSIWQLSKIKVLP